MYRTPWDSLGIYKIYFLFKVKDTLLGSMRPHTSNMRGVVKCPPASPNVIVRKLKRKRNLPNKEKENHELKAETKMPSAKVLEKRYQDDLLAKGFDTLSTYLADFEMYLKTSENGIKDSTFFPSLTKVVNKKLKLTAPKPPEAKPEMFTFI